MFDTLKRPIPSNHGLLCPRCEKPLAGHDEKACAMRMSRRYFFGIVVGGVAVAANGGIPQGPVVAPESIVGLSYLSMEMLAQFAVLTLERFPYTTKGTKIGDTIRIRKPARYVSV